MHVTISTAGIFGQRRPPEEPVSELQGGRSGVVAGILAGGWSGSDAGALLSPVGESLGNDRSIFFLSPLRKKMWIAKAHNKFFLS